MHFIEDYLIYVVLLTRTEQCICCILNFDSRYIMWLHRSQMKLEKLQQKKFNFTKLAILAKDWFCNVLASQTIALQTHLYFFVLYSLPPPNSNIHPGTPTIAQRSNPHKQRQTKYRNHMQMDGCYMIYCSQKEDFYSCIVCIGLLTNLQDIHTWNIYNFVMRMCGTN